MLDPLVAQQDRLARLHANTQIPKLIGMARQFELTGDPEPAAAARFFRHTVVAHHSYVIGGNADREYFQTPDSISQFVTEQTCEHCNSYNMLRLSALLYRLAALSAEGDAADLLPAETRVGARTLHAWLDWPVAQLVTLGMALVGNFDTVVGAWKDNGGAGFDPHAEFMVAAGRASVRVEVAEEVRDYVEEGVAGTAVAVHMGELPELRDAMSLAWRILLLWLAVLAMFVLAGWVA